MTSATEFDLDRPPPSEVWLQTDSSDDDANWAQREFEGLTGRQAWKLFSVNVFGAGESIGSMPDDAFKYYIVSFALYVDQLDFQSDDNAAAAANCLFGNLEERKERSPGAVRVVVPMTAPVLDKLAKNQVVNDMPQEIYGDLTSRAKALLS
jgi:hypothetical protein